MCQPGRTYFQQKATKETKKKGLDWVRLGWIFEDSLGFSWIYEPGKRRGRKKGDILNHRATEAQRAGYKNSDRPWIGAV